MRILTRKPLLSAAVIFAACAAVLWGAGIWAPMNDRDQRCDLSAATAFSIIAAVCVVNRVRRDKEKQFLVNVAITQHERITRLASQAPTVPLQRLPQPRRTRTGRRARLS